MNWEYLTRNYLPVSVVETDNDTGREDWEYVDSTDLLTEALPKLGAEGWELVSVVGLSEDGLYAVFKRPVAPAPLVLKVPEEKAKEFKKKLQKSGPATALKVGGEATGINTETPLAEPE